MQTSPSSVNVGVLFQEFLVQAVHPGAVLRGVALVVWVRLVEIFPDGNEVPLLGPPLVGFPGERLHDVRGRAGNELRGGPLFVGAVRLNGLLDFDVGAEALVVLDEPLPGQAFGLLVGRPGDDLQFVLGVLVKLDVGRLGRRQSAEANDDKAGQNALSHQHRLRKGLRPTGIVARMR